MKGKETLDEAKCTALCLKPNKDSIFEDCGRLEFSEDGEETDTEDEVESDGEEEEREGE